MKSPPRQGRQAAGGGVFWKGEAGWKRARSGSPHGIVTALAKEKVTAPWPGGPGKVTLTV